MARPYLSTDELLREMEWLEAIEAGATTVTQIAAEVGLSRQRVYQRIQSARKRRTLIAIEADLKAKPRDLPWVEIMHGSSEGFHYNLSNDKYSLLPSGPFRIGTSGGGTQVVRSDDDRTRVRGEKPKPPAKFKPKKPRKQR